MLSIGLNFDIDSVSNMKIDEVMSLQTDTYNIAAEQVMDPIVDILADIIYTGAIKNSEEIQPSAT